MPPGSQTRLYEVQLDIYIARRKRMHAIYDLSGVPVFHAPHLLQILNWFHEQGVTSATFTDDESAYVVTFERRPLQDNSQPGD